MPDPQNAVSVKIKLPKTAEVTPVKDPKEEAELAEIEGGPQGNTYEHRSSPSHEMSQEDVDHFLCTSPFKDDSHVRPEIPMLDRRESRDFRLVDEDNLGMKCPQSHSAVNQKPAEILDHFYGGDPHYQLDSATSAGSDKATHKDSVE